MSFQTIYSINYGYSNKSDTVMIQQECYKVDHTRL